MTQKVSTQMIQGLDDPLTAGNFLRVKDTKSLEERTPAEVRADIGAGVGDGSVTSVAVADATGITWTGSPITTAGTLTPTLSANLQAWSGLATSSKQNADATLTALAGANWVANSLPIGSGADTVAQVTFAANTFPGRSSSGNLVAKTITDAAFSLLDDADAATMRTTLGIPTLAFGTYTPTLTNVTNVDASAVSSAFTYMRIGDIVHVAGVITIDATTASALSELGISLPIASNFTNAAQAAGVASSSTTVGLTGGIGSDSTNDRAALKWQATSITDNRSWSVVFQYQVL